MSATSSLPTMPSLSRSRIWKPSRSILTWAGWSCESALLPALPPKDLPLGDWGRADWVAGSILGVVGSGRGVKLSCVLVGVELFSNFARALARPDFVGEVDGVVCRNGEPDGDAGDSGRLNGELRCCCCPKPSGDGLYPECMALAVEGASCQPWLFALDNP